MTSKEIFELRKSPNNDSRQTFAFARDLINQNSQDEWNQRAYGWALYDVIKTELKAKNSDVFPNLISLIDEYLNAFKCDDLLLAKTK